MAFQTLIVEHDDHVCLIRINRPEALNALNSQVMSELGQAISEADQNEKIRVVVLTGSDKAFAAGADISEMGKKGFMDVFCADMFGRKTLEPMYTRKPMIAAVSGYALGGGCELAMMCDFILCGDNAKFGQPEINLGVIAGMGGTQRLTRLVGKSKAMDMNLTGRMMDADEAERSGLVSRVFPAKTLLEETLKIAHKIAEKSIISTMAAKEAVNRAEETSLAEGLLFERRVFQSLFATDDQAEGMAAFVEKRVPQFRDK